MAKTLPTKGSPRDAVMHQLKSLHADDAKWKDGKTFSLVYFAGDEVSQLLKDAYSEFIAENGLSPVAFPSLRQMECEVVSMAASLLGGDDAPCVRCGGPCVEGQMNAQHVCFACLCVEACGGEREAMAELQRVMALTKGETPPGTRVTLRAACEDMEAHVRDTAAVLAAAPVPPLGAPAVVRSFDAATRMYTVALSDGSGALGRRVSLRGSISGGCWFSTDYNAGQIWSASPSVVSSAAFTTARSASDRSPSLRASASVSTSRGASSSVATAPSMGLTSPSLGLISSPMERTRTFSKMTSLRTSPSPRPRASSLRAMSRRSGSVRARLRAVVSAARARDSCPRRRSTSARMLW
jgi:hypothetical protein